ncbi:MAG: LysE family translocator [Rhizobiales bacterium]|nr:LysE family translocator [Hyphomicrobiales bacterium]NRB14868.1 LysE family translocator [Hyphomicrobiales bacterium]
MTIEALLLMIPACFAINMIPGPNIILSIRNGIQTGYVSSMVGVFGRFTAFIFYAILTVVGLGIIIANSLWAFTAIKIVGAIYLIYIGVMSIKNGMNLGDFEQDIGTQRSYYVIFKEEALVGFTNPKIVLIFTALLPQFISSTQDFTSQFFWLTAMFCALELVSTSIYVGGVLLFAEKFKSHKGQTILSRLIGSFLIGFGVLMAASNK